VAEAKPLSDNVEEYLEAIHRLSQSPRGVSTTGLATQLAVTPASVTGMLRRLAGLGLITYRRYHDISLTREGERRALSLIRRHRLAERLLTDLLRVPLAEAHDQACRLEHVVSSDLEGRIADALGDPQACPHGHPLDPSARDRTISLLDAPLGRPLTLARLDDESPDVVRYLAERGLLPGKPIALKQRMPAAATVVIEAAGQTHTIGASLAATIRVHRPRRAN